MADDSVVEPRLEGFSKSPAAGRRRRAEGLLGKRGIDRTLRAAKSCLRASSARGNRKKVSQYRHIEGE